MPDADAGRCPSCGARWSDEATCQQRFDEALALEFGDVRFGAVHHLTVPAFMLQHDRYTHDGWLATRALLAEFLAEGLRPEEARRRRPRLEGSFSRGAPFARFAEIRWTRTIADLDLTDAAAYRRDVEAWARSVIRDSAAVVDA